LKPEHSPTGATLQQGDTSHVRAQLPLQGDIDRELELRERTGSVAARSSCFNASNSPRKAPLNWSGGSDWDIAGCQPDAD